MTRRSRKTGRFCRPSTSRWTRDQVTSNTSPLCCDHGYASKELPVFIADEGPGNNAALAIRHAVSEVEVVSDEGDQLPGFHGLKSIDDCWIVCDDGIFLRGLCCLKCCLPLDIHASDCILGIQTTGISGSLVIVCKNNLCQHINSVPHSKQQHAAHTGRHSFDVNKKLPLGM